MDRLRSSSQLCVTGLAAHNHSQAKQTAMHKCDDVATQQRKPLLLFLFLGLFLLRAAPRHLEAYPTCPFGTLTRHPIPCHTGVTSHPINAQSPHFVRQQNCTTRQTSVLSHGSNANSPAWSPDAHPPFAMHLAAVLPWMHELAPHTKRRFVPANACPRNFDSFAEIVRFVLAAIASSHRSL